MPARRRQREEEEAQQQPTPPNQSITERRKVDLNSAKQFCHDAASNQALMANSRVVSQFGTEEAARVSGYQLPENVFSHRVRPKIPLMDQQQAGLCWMYAGAGVLLHHAEITAGYRAKYNPLSIAYWAFWQTYERANLWLNEVINRIDLSYDSPEMLHFLRDRVDYYSTADDATAATFQALVNKYGAIPAQAMPLSLATFSSNEYSDAVKKQLQEIYCHLRRTYGTMSGNKVPLAEIKQHLMAQKNTYLQDIFNILVVHFGKPVFPEQKFQYNYRFRDDDRSDDEDDIMGNVQEIKAAKDAKKPKFKQEKNAGEGADAVEIPPILNLNYGKFEGTPIDFAKRLLAHENGEYVQLCTNDAPGFEKTRKYRDPHYEAAVDGQPYEYINVTWKDMQKCIVASINANEAIELSANLREFDHSRGVAGHDQINHQQLYQTSITATRAERQACYNIVPEHAMQIIAYHDPFGTGKPTRFRIQNSWGVEYSEPYITADTNWMERFCTGILVRKEFVPKQLLQAANAKQTIEVARSRYHIE